jgi:hypothetical protein
MTIRKGREGQEERGKRKRRGEEKKMQRKNES